MSGNNVLLQLARDRGGNFTLMTALLMVPLLLAAGLAVDYTNATVEKSNMQQIADSAALAGGHIYDGTNAAAAVAAAKAFVSGQSSSLPAGFTYSAAMSGQTVEVTINGPVSTSLMNIAGIGNVKVGVVADAVTPDKPRSITFTPTKAQGWYYKKVSIIVVRLNSTAEETIGTVTYQPTTHDNDGQGTMVVSPSATLDLGKYSKLVLQMQIKNDGCPLGSKVSMSGTTVTCVTTNATASKSYDLTLRTDNPATTNYLFVDGVQMAAGVSSPLETILECNKTSNHAWEDGGGWARQDFFYTAKSVCGPDGQFVRLTK